MKTPAPWLFALGAVLLADALAAAPPSAKQPVPSATPPSAALESVELLPPEAALVGPRATQRFIVLGRFADGRQWDLTGRAAWTVDAPPVATVQAGTVAP